MFFSCINVHQVPREMFEIEGCALEGRQKMAIILLSKSFT